MKNVFARNNLFYVLVVGSCLLVMWWIYHQGTGLEIQKINGSAPAVLTQESFSINHVWKDLGNNATHDLSRLMIQIIVIIAASRVFAYIFNKIRQPAVIGEILAGILLGPSLLGLHFPGVSNFLFPPESLQNLQFLSQIGLVLFMFIIGMELDLSVLRKKAHSAVIVSHASIIFPFVLGMGLAYFLYLEFANEGVDFLSFSLFLGIAMSITAFPVLARILQERGWTRTPLGSMVITCAAADDVTAWCILALVITLIKAGVATGAIFTILLSVGYLSLMIFVIRPFLRKIGNIYISKENLNKNVIGFIFIVLLFSSLLTEVIGIHALFGAFVAGACMPQNINFKKVLSEKIEDISLVLLLPLFFVFTGLRTEIGLLNSWHHWGIAAVVIAVATAGKFVGSAVAARFTGQNWKDSLIIGVLMNTRGLMELIVLNIGFDLGILSREIFTIMVIMALFTTFMAGPVLELIEYVSRRRSNGRAASSGNAFYNILISFGPPRMGATLLKLAEKLVYREKATATVSALHLTADPEVSPQEALLFEKEGFQPIRKAANDLQVRLHSIYKLTDDIDNEIIRTCSAGSYDLLLVGGARSLFTENIMGGKVGQILHSAKCDVGILVDKGINDIGRVLGFYTGAGGRLWTETVQRIAADPQVSISLVNISDGSSELPFAGVPNISWEEHRKIDKDFLDKFDVLVIEYPYWTSLAKAKTYWLTYCPSVFIVKEQH